MNKFNFFTWIMETKKFDTHKFWSPLALILNHRTKFSDQWTELYSPGCSAKFWSMKIAAVHYWHSFVGIESCSSRLSVQMPKPNSPIYHFKKIIFYWGLSIILIFLYYLLVGKSSTLFWLSFVCENYETFEDFSAQKNCRLITQQFGFNFNHFDLNLMELNLKNLIFFC